MEITHLPFLEVVKDITSRFNKIPNKDFVNHGKYAIIDQGANIIAGYTNDETVITDLGYPLIVFGDHTRVLKYVNYPFAIGADGVKVLSVDTKKAYPLYVYYFLKFLKIPNAGYSRHFKFLKEKKIALPKDIDEQKRIAKVLSECEDLIQKRKESIDLLDDLLKSKFFEMFGDPRTNSKEWEIDSVITYADCIVPARDKPKSFTGSIPWVTTVDILHLGKTIKSKQDIGLSEEDISQAGARIIPKESVIMTCVGDLGVVSIAENNMVINQQLHAFQCKESMNNIFLMYVLSFQKQYMYKVASKTTVPYMNKTNCNSIPTIKPPIDFQIEFATAYERTNEIKKQAFESLKELENLYGSISQRAFNGELDLSKVDISDMEDSKKKDLEAVKEDLTDEQFEDLINSFEHTLPTGEVPSNRETDIRNMSIRQYLRLPEYDEATEGIEFSFMNKDFFYQFILTKGFADRTFTLPELERYARKYILRGTGFEFTYDNWKTILFRFIGAKQPLIEQVLEEYQEGDKLTKGIKLKLTDEAFKV